MNLAYKILSSKLKDGKLVPGEQIGIQIDQTLTQDSTGTMAYLQFLGYTARIERHFARVSHCGTLQESTCGLYRKQLCRFCKGLRKFLPFTNVR